MIYLFVNTKLKLENNSTVMIPYEINNKFLGRLSRMSKNHEIPFDFSFLRLNDFGDIVIKNEELSVYLNQLNSLMQNIEEVIKYLPLPNTIWGLDGRRFDEFQYNMEKDTENGTDSEIPVSKEGIPLTMTEFLKLMNLIKEKIEIAQNLGVGVTFSTD